ncbi:Hypothetical protein LUCI_3834 [Lucifera butyrica]|uniref:Uncharacterized protein n=1 Tax=Lucifera butyrica TaxID=1351585 RepID=A0A498R736_9FIRM|nr:hypothetical protein [Lucifera butyrica]VBB08556.1 Hypothetical protein LUCI_3834 [Lucifera butyrica]
MPRCRVCGNTSSFGSSRIPPPAQSANGPLSGLAGDFNGNEIVRTRSLGADKQVTTAALDNPAAFFDICLYCGSQEVDWGESPA